MSNISWRLVREQEDVSLFQRLSRVLYGSTSAAMTVRRNEKRPISDVRRNRWEFKRSVDSVGIPKSKICSKVCHFCSFNRPESLERISKIDTLWHHHSSPRPLRRAGRRFYFSQVRHFKISVLIIRQPVDLVYKVLQEQKNVVHKQK